MTILYKEINFIYEKYISISLEIVEVNLSILCSFHPNLGRLYKDNSLFKIIGSSVNKTSTNNWVLIVKLNMKNGSPEKLKEEIKYLLTRDSAEYTEEKTIVQSEPEKRSKLNRIIYLDSEI